MNRKVLLGILLIVMVLALTGCIPGNERYTADAPAGFFWGVWHGWIAPISLIVQLFNPAVRIYEVSNTGWWYDFGFYMAILGGFGGFSLSRRKSRD